MDQEAQKNSAFRKLLSERLSIATKITKTLVTIIQNRISGFSFGSFPCGENGVGFTLVYSSCTAIYPFWRKAGWDQVKT